MNKLFRLILIFLSALIVITFNFNGSASQLDFDDGIDRFITSQMKTHNIPGLALAITHNNQVLHVKGYSAANNDHPVTAQTQFLIASVSKSFTAIAVMQLVEARQIDLDSPVQAYLPEFALTDPSFAQQPPGEIDAKVTIRHLLNQVSGLSDVGFPELQLSQATTIGERVTSLSQARPVELPGAQFHYFNPNYEVLARVVEVVSQQPFSDYLQTHIFTPLQMSRTLNATTRADASQGATNMAQGHLMAFGLPFAYPEMSGYLSGSGGIVSTAEDMANYLIFQTNSGQFQETKLFSESSVVLMHTPPKAISSSYGMGWFKGSENGETAIEHNGILSTFYTDVVLLPKEKYGIALLYNINASPLISMAFPQIKTGLIQLLKDGQPAVGGFSVTLWGIAIALLMFISVTLAIRSLLYLPQWRQSIHRTPLWRVWLGIGFTFLPAFFLLILPWIFALVSDRFFGHVLLFRSMLDLMLWLSVCAVLGVVNGIARLIFLARSNRLDAVS
ncbi:MAG: beta-lactamase family protein [Nodosilinea sp. WJT8-NPBG4]|jgi:CubicO group peptidase (beta-lactamase class C family)|nr:beta-lactamase family protein [Nodosilinea sp. WJT8-NPBG4]